jgi:hypothetical protein
MSNTPRDPDTLKVFNSSVYRKRVKRMVEFAKTVRGIHRKLPKGNLGPLKSNATEKEKRIRAQEDAARLTVNTIHFFANTVSGFSSSNRDAAPTSNENTQS